MGYEELRELNRRKWIKKWEEDYNKISTSSSKIRNLEARLANVKAMHSHYVRKRDGNIDHDQDW